MSAPPRFAVRNRGPFSSSFSGSTSNPFGSKTSKGPKKNKEQTGQGNQHTTLLTPKNETTISRSDRSTRKSSIVMKNGSYDGKEEPDTITDRFEILHHIGEHFSSSEKIQRLQSQKALTFCARDKVEKCLVALKLFVREKDPFHMQKVDELKIQEYICERFPQCTPRILHSGLYRYKGIDNVTAVATPFYTGGSLYDKIKKKSKRQMTSINPMSEKQAAVYILQILSILEGLHANRIIHRDIKPENFLVEKNPEQDTNQLFLIDFGFACFEQGHDNFEGPHEACGTIDYIAPEMLTCTKPGQMGFYDHKVDVWATGIMLYEMLTGITPFSHYSQRRDILHAIVSLPFDETLAFQNTNPSQKMVKCLSAMLEKNPQKRPSAAEAKRMLL
jgi:serine/threonine protein kinase